MGLKNYSPFLKYIVLLLTICSTTSKSFSHCEVYIIPLTCSNANPHINVQPSVTFAQHQESSSQAVSTCLPINQPGNYYLTTSIAGPLIIQSDNVSINLKKHSIVGPQGIIIESNLSNISIENGLIEQPTQEGIRVKEGCRNIIIKDVSFDNFAGAPAIRLQGHTSNPIIGFSIKNCSFAKGLNALTIVKSNNGRITECTFSDLNGSALLFSESNGIEITQCVVNGTKGIDYGVIEAHKSYGLIFRDCSIQHCEATNSVTGFLLSVDTANVLIDHCIIKSLKTNGVANGISCSGSNVTIIDLLVSRIVGTNPMAAANNGIILLGHGNVVRNCVVSTLHNSSLGAIQGQAGISINGTANAIVENCIVENIGHGNDGLVQGISIGSNAHGVIKNCICQTIVAGSSPTQAYAQGFAAVGGAKALFEECTALSVSCPNNRATGFHLMGVSDVVMRKCIVEEVFSDNQAHGISFGAHCTENSIVDCMINNVKGGVSSVGIVAHHNSLNNLIFNSIISAINGSGISLGAAAVRTVVKNCTITHCSNLGIVDNGQESILLDNTILFDNLSTTSLAS